ncbi:MAG: class I poly(R)-hydroxyalkanoic acid synthase [Pacificimonas sp.]|jgi:polyhydroxyalkanoate synthase|nr:class I poly(R)-hydroxyalkanoic acid synthase [Pacificimonas sp.]
MAKGSDANDSGTEDAAPPLPDMTAMAERMTYVSGKMQQMMMQFWTEQQEKSAGAAAQPLAAPTIPAPSALDPFGMAQLWPQVTTAMLSDPARLAQMQADFMQDAAKLWQNLLSGDADGDETAQKGRPDRRFAGEGWTEIPAFHFIKQAYLMASQYLLDAVTGTEGLSEKEREKAAFYTKQYVDALSPSNYALTNPEVLRETMETGGENLLKGTENMLGDLERGRMRMTDEDAFEVGVNVAATPGQVVFENRLFQLIQYTPTTKQVYEVPLLIFPPWINKFYILDLTKEKSFIAWCLDQGIQVYVVSWKNADETLADVELDHYVLEGFLPAIDKAIENTGAPAVNTIGYCVAGTTLSAVLAYLDEKGDAEKVLSATFFTAQVDFTEAGDLQVFVDDNELEKIDELAAGQGYLDGRYMASTFNMLRSNDLIWNYVVNNYLMGRQYLPFDLLYWNSDATNVPAKWHAAYLRDLYRDNKLAQPGGITVDGVPIDLGTVKTPVYIQAGKDDHIAPLPSVWKLTEHFGGEKRFLLAGSGHIAGVVNPPSAKKYQHWTLDGDLPDTLAEFQDQATEHPGSWWPNWLDWIAPRSGEKVKATPPGKGKLKAIEPAPGRYVKERIGAS